MLVAFLIRMAVVAFVFRDIAAPVDRHSEFGYEMGWTARSIALGHGFSSPYDPMGTGPTALVPPFYVYILALVFRVFGIYTAKASLAILTVNCVLSSLTCVPVYFSVKHALDTRLARFSAMGWALYPFAIYFSADRVWDYALTSLLLCTCFWAAQKLHLRSRWGWAVFGALFGLAALSNPSVLSVFPFLLLLAIIRVRQVSGPWISNALVTFAALALVCAPWAIRNERVMHAPSMIRDGFGLELFAGNNGDTSESNPGWAHPASNPVEMQKYIAMGEVRYMAEKHALAIDYIKHHPKIFLGATIHRAVRFWTGYWSFKREYLAHEPTDIPCFLFCCGLLIFTVRGIIRWIKEDPSTALPYVLALIFFPFTYYLTHSSMDYRQPIEPAILIMVTVGMFGIRETVPAWATSPFDPYAEEDSDDEPNIVAA
jgi:4-amino-4-deoxy-L-arabinose transferase-like glycosyltransferase